MMDLMYPLGPNMYLPEIVELEKAERGRLRPGQMMSPRGGFQPVWVEALQ